MSLLLIENHSPSAFRVTNANMTIDITGPTLEEALVTALNKAGVGDDDFIHQLTGSFSWAEAIQTLMEDGNVQGHYVTTIDKNGDLYPPGNAIIERYNGERVNEEDGS